MAAGITQPGGGANPILFEDNANAAAGGDGSYSFADISAAFPALCVDLGTTPKTYRLTVSLINGDGVGTATTTLKDADCSVVFDATRTYSVSATGRSNRFTEFGTKIDGTKDSGRAGVTLVSGATLNIGGNGKFYGSTLKTTTGALTLAPAQTGLSYEIVNCILQSANNGINLGTGAGAIDSIYNVDVIGGSGAAGTLINFNVTQAERVTVGALAAASDHIRTGADFKGKDVVFIGSPTTAQVRYTNTSDSHLIIPTWDQTIRINSTFTQGRVHEWWPYGILVLDGNAAPVAGLPFTLKDNSGRTVLTATTDAEGKITYSATYLDISLVEQTAPAIAANCVEVTKYGAAGVTSYQGPFRAELNVSGAINTSWPQRTITFDWPTTAIWTNGVQYADMYDIIQLEPPPGNPTNWVELAL